ncbi:unnamed protein product [Darwinula stevensoni]|uniref:Uncharacterized protein n=1 Tax=Darwinula stevensoni TaxID=69355 RepID=A0A7R8XD39_9CRUS|nr:unnamed protein product [Darwinula stevensoni]CAG0894344.1 unnamed protein product [Darwinula stevensoni]
MTEQQFFWQGHADGQPGAYVTSKNHLLMTAVCFNMTDASWDFFSKYDGSAPHHCHLMSE